MYQIKKQKKILENKVLKGHIKVLSIRFYIMIKKQKDLSFPG